MRWGPVVFGPLSSYPHDPSHFAMITLCNKGDRMSGSVPFPESVGEMLELGRRARRHAATFAHDEVGERLLAFAEELERRAEVLMGGGSGEDTAPSE